MSATSAVVARLARDRTPTPVLVYAEACIRENVGALRGALASAPDVASRIHFAVKACYTRRVLACLRAERVGVEVMTALEWDLVRAAGFDGAEVICNGIGREDRYLESAYLAGAKIIADGQGDFDRVAALAARHGRPVTIGIRVQLDLSSFPHTPYARANKLGIPVGSAAWKHIVEACEHNPLVRLDMLHVHGTLNETEPELYCHVLGDLDALRRQLEGAGRRTRIRTIDIGGGLYTRAEDGSGATAVVARVAAEFAVRFPGVELVIEPGRYLVNSAGFVVTTVTDTKQVDGRHFVFLDAGTNVLIPIPTAHYGLAHPRPDASGAYLCDLVDGITNPGNVVAHEVRLASLPVRGDRLVLENCGAYTMAMAEFWAFDPFPVEWLAESGERTALLDRSAIEAARRALLGV